MTNSHLVLIHKVIRPGEGEFESGSYNLSVDMEVDTTFNADSNGEGEQPAAVVVSSFWGMLLVNLDSVRVHKVEPEGAYRVCILKWGWYKCFITLCMVQRKTMNRKINKCNIERQWITKAWTEGSVYWTIVMRLLVCIIFILQMSGALVIPHVPHSQCSHSA